MSRRKKVRKEEEHRIFRELIDRLPEDVKSRSLYTLTKGEPKLSAVLLDFLEPDMDDWETEDELRDVVSFGVLAWNMALLPLEERKKSFSECLAGMPLAERLTLKRVLDMLIRRKEEHFVDDRRGILEYSLTMTGNGPHLTVVSSPVRGQESSGAAEQ